MNFVGIVTIKNLSTYADHAAIARVARLLAGDEYRATHDGIGNQVISIARSKSCFIVTDMEDAK